ncbi:pantetheine-phosphate adenylyltransferase [Cryomorphaceae bacterium]|nr:pantetheine-phosphate adenylyltransferase [Cryomorphaceae bacterium]
MSRIAVFPGSFDPITNGHVDIVQRAVGLFDKIIIAVGQNAQKKYMFTREQRVTYIKNAFEGVDEIEVMDFEGLTVDFCRSVGARYLLRGLRNPADFEFEKAIAQANRMMDHQLETVFLLTDPEFAAISSSIVRDVYRNGGDVSMFVPVTIG